MRWLPKRAADAALHRPDERLREIVAGVVARAGRDHLRLLAGDARGDRRRRIDGRRRHAVDAFDRPVARRHRDAEIEHAGVRLSHRVAWPRRCRRTSVSSVSMSASPISRACIRTMRWRRSAATTPAEALPVEATEVAIPPLIRRCRDFRRSHAGLGLLRARSFQHQQRIDPHVEPRRVTGGCDEDGRAAARDNGRLREDLLLRVRAPAADRPARRTSSSPNADAARSRARSAPTAPITWPCSTRSPTSRPAATGAGSCCSRRGHGRAARCRR